jgi:hypothetical protein
MRDRLNLPGAPGRVFKPGGGDELLVKFSAPGGRGLIVILDFFELVIEPLFEKVSHESPQLSNALRIGVGHSGSSLCLLKNVLQIIHYTFSVI